MHSTRSVSLSAPLASVVVSLSDTCGERSTAPFAYGECDRLAIATDPSNHAVNTQVVRTVPPQLGDTAMSSAPAVTRTAADEAFVAKALTEAQRALARRSSPTVVKPVSCLAQFKAKKEAEALVEVAAALPLVTLDLPKPNSIGAAEFLRRVNHVEHGVSLTRDGIIVAIAAYCGYNRTLPFGLQEFNARWTALRELRGPVVKFPQGHHHRAHGYVVGGYIHGMPFETQRVVMDLLSRERVAAEDMAASEYAARKVLESDAEDKVAQSLAHAQMAAACQEEIISLRGKLNAILNAC
jgi:hypothetical protein